MSLDGYIAGLGGEFDWIPHDEAIDFAAFFRTVDTVLMGRRTFEVVRSHGAGPHADLRPYVFSSTLQQESYPDATIASDAAPVVRELREEEGKDIWLMGGGSLFRSLLDANLVDTVEIGLVPVLLGRGIPMLPDVAMRRRLKLAKSESFASGIVLLKYDVEERHQP